MKVNEQPSKTSHDLNLIACSLALAVYLCVVVVDSVSCVFRQSYDVDIEVGVAGSGVTSSNTLDLKNPCFRYTGQPVQAPPGTNNTSPSDAYWASVQDATGNDICISVRCKHSRLMNVAEAGSGYSVLMDLLSAHSAYS